MSERKPERIFISYSRQDKQWMLWLKGQLDYLVRKGEVELWIDEKDIDPGDRFNDEILEGLETCGAAIMLVSDHFSSSDYIQTHEFPLLKQFAANDEVRLFWLRVRDCLLAEDLAGEYHSVTGNESLEHWEKHDRGQVNAIFTELARKLRLHVQNANVGRVSQPDGAEAKDQNEETTGWETRPTELGASYWAHLPIELHFLDREHGLRIEDAFIDLKVVPTDASEHEKGLNEHDDETREKMREKARDVEPIPFHEVFTLSKEAETPWNGLLVQGDPGSGKTTGCRQMAWLLAGKPELAPQMGLPEGMRPVFFKLRNLGPNDVTEAAVEEAICREIASVAGRPDETEAARRLLHTYPALILILDGLDEVRSFKAMEAVARLCRTAERRKGVERRILVTARTELKAAEKFLVFQHGGTSVVVRAAVQDFTPEQVEQFIAVWFELHGRPGLAQSLGDRIRAKHNWAEFMSNPLMLSLTCQLHAACPERFPEDRLTLFCRCARQSLERRAAELPAGASLDLIQWVLEDLAWWLQQQDSPASCAKLAMARQLGVILKRHGSNQEPLTLLETLTQSGGVITVTGGHNEGDGEPLRGFVHQQFREALAAAYLLRRENPSEEMQTLCNGLLDHKKASTWLPVAQMAVHGGSSAKKQEFVRDFFRTLVQLPFFEAERAHNRVEWARDFVNRCHFPRIAREQLISALQTRDLPEERQTMLLHFLRGGEESGLLDLAASVLGSRTAVSREDSALVRKAHEVLLLARPEPIPVDPEPGNLWVEPQTRMVFTWLPPGKFEMGDPEARFSPPHWETITQGFWLALYPCTQREWTAVMGGNPSEFQTSDLLPVESVSQYGISDFLRKMNQKTGLRFELLTEAQWEYACRAGTTTKFSFGNEAEDMTAHGWFSKNSQNQTHEVGLKLPNPWGLYDMHGNVWEWCQDWHENYNRKDNLGIRGGGWNHNARNCWSATVAWCAPHLNYNDIGFRPAIVPLG